VSKKERTVIKISNISTNITQTLVGAIAPISVDLLLAVTSIVGESVFKDPPGSETLKLNECSYKFLL